MLCEKCRKKMIIYSVGRNHNTGNLGIYYKCECNKTIKKDDN